MGSDHIGQFERLLATLDGHGGKALCVKGNGQIPVAMLLVPVDADGSPAVVLR
jgi:hypothetical protein